MTEFLSDVFAALEDNVFQELPVDVKTFVEGEAFLNHPPLSPLQYLIVECMSQVYYEPELIKVLGEEKGVEHYRKYTKNELILALGKGAGKDLSSTVGVAYIVYKLLCLNDPARYYGKPPGDAIDIMNVAINAQQAKTVFFKGFKNKIEKSPWFRNKFRQKVDSIEFDKSITVYSGHSERESHEGLNLFAAILDEISGFAIESNSGNVLAKTADALYKAFRGTVDSRFPDVGKCVLLSFPRYKNDYIWQKYEEAVAEKEVMQKSYTFKIDDDLPDGIKENELTIEWDEDHIISYRLPGVFALKRPTWEVNPTRKIEDFKNAFFADKEDALQRFCCMPPAAVSGYFTNHQKIIDTFNLPPLVVEGESFPPHFVPNPDFEYFMHVDLAQKHDRCALAVAHVESWSVSSLIMGEEDLSANVKVDFVYWWTPNKEKTVDFLEVKEFILDAKRRGFDFKLVTFDRWNSLDTMQKLNAAGVQTETLSVAKPHYDEFKMCMMENRIQGPDIQILRDELMQLRLIKGKVDHPRSGSKDLADATCGAVYNAITLSTKELLNYADVKDLSTISREQQKKESESVIRAPSGSMPSEIAEFLNRIKAI